MAASQPSGQYVHWETIAVESLPTGWRNAYADDDGSIQYYPCPALLLQEARRTARGSITENHKAPYQTRVVFADFERDSAELHPANIAGNYVRTLAPGEPDIG